MTICGPGEADRWLQPFLKQRAELVDDMIVATNNATDKEKEMIKSYGFWQYEDNREWGIYQPQIKDDLLQKVAKLKPDWILPSDTDELYGASFTRAKAEELAKTDAISYEFYIINLWNDDGHYSRAHSFHNVRYFRYRPDLGMRFERKNVHCGWAPPVFYNYAWVAPHMVKHYGLMKPEDRVKKIQRYAKYDPEGKFKSKEWYESLKEERCSTFVEADVQTKVEADVLTHYKHQHLKHV